MFKRVLNILSGDPFEREYNHYKAIVDKVAAFEPEMEKRSDEELRDLTEMFRERIRQHTAGIEDHVERLKAERDILDAILPEAFAVVREASRRTTGLRHYDVQVIGGAALHESRIAEMKTGEGKTLVASLPLYLNALVGRGVHLVTVNDYLARRDGGWMGPIFQLLGLTVGVIGKEQYSAIYDPDYVDPTGHLEDERLVHWRPVPRRECYLADVTYGTASEFGFDYLRDNTTVETTRLVQREHYFSIVDEVDSVLIDGARTPLIISGPARKASDNYQIFADVVERARLRRNTTNLDEDEEPDGDYVYEERTKSVSLTDMGIEKVERLLPMVDTDAGQSLYDPQFYELVSYLDNALKARYVFKRDIDYIVQGGRVILVDQTTGRPMPSRRYSEGLHQAIEAKEGVSVRREDETIATITVQSYFRMYSRLAGMTGTALTQSEEFHEVYGLEVIPIPTNVEFRATQGELETRKERDQGVPVVTYFRPDNNGDRPDFYKRTDYDDEVFLNQNAKFNAVAAEIKELYDYGRPVLVGTGSVEASEILSSKLDQLGVPHEILNAKNHEREALIVAQAGRPGAVTISTSMAGRGTDILLGGNPEGLAAEMMSDRCFESANFTRLVKEVTDGHLDAAAVRIENDPRMMGDKDLIGWIQAKNEELTAKAQVEDVLGAVISELRSEPQYSSVDYETITQMVRQVDLSSYDSRRMDRARDQVKEQNLPASLIPDIEYKLKEYRSLKGLFGQQGFIDMLAQQLYEQHYNARAALVRAVLNGDEDEAKDICAETPSLPEALADEVKAIVEDCRQKRREVWEKGGLHVIGTERHESRRIDDQLRGRAGRQGDPGSSHFFLSMEDELMMRFGGPRTQRILERLNIPEDTPISANVLSNVIEQSQNRFEGYYFDIRKNLVEYDEAVNRQRNIVYEERRSILEGDGTDLDTMVQQFIRDTLQDLVQRLAYGYEEWAQGEIESAIGDFSSVDTGEVNARAVVQRVLSLFPRPPQDELDDLLTVNEADVLSEALMEYVRMGLDEDHNLRMLHGEISRLMPLWPVLPPFKQRGTENWEGFSTQVLAAFDHYAQHMPQAARAEARTDLEASLERAFREQVAAINQGENLNEVKTTLEKALTTVLNDAMQAAIVETEPDLMIDILLERVNYLLDVARLPREGDIAADVWPLDRQAFAIGEDELGNYQRAIMLTVIDREWRQYLKAIDDLRQGAGLAAFGQRDPKVEFKRRAFEMFDALRQSVQEGIARRFFSDLPRHRQIVEQQKMLDQQLDQAVKFGYRIKDQKGGTTNGGRRSRRTTKSAATLEADMWAKVGRNDPCPCGSGKKFKDCHYPLIREQQAASAPTDAAAGSSEPPSSSRSRRRRRRRG